MIYWPGAANLLAEIRIGICSLILHLLASSLRLVATELDHLLRATALLVVTANLRAQGIRLLHRLVTTVKLKRSLAMLKPSHRTSFSKIPALEMYNNRYIFILLNLCITISFFIQYERRTNLSRFEGSSSISSSDYFGTGSSGGSGPRSSRPGSSGASYNIQVFEKLLSSEMPVPYLSSCFILSDSWFGWSERERSSRCHQSRQQALLVGQRFR